MKGGEREGRELKPGAIAFRFYMLDQAGVWGDEECWTLDFLGMQLNWLEVSQKQFVN